MEVLSKKSSKKLLKGVKYTAESFYNSTTPSTNRWSHGRIRIKGFGSYMCVDFTDINGNPLPQTNYVNPQSVNQVIEKFDPRELKTGDIIVCLVDKYKYLLKGGKYKISQVTSPNNWSAMIKLEGYGRLIRFSNWSFRRLSTQETRDIALSSIFDTPEKFSVDFVRKFEKENNQIKILLETISKSIIDPYRHELDVVDWAIAKTKNQGLKRSDFDSILKLPLGEVLKMFENSQKN